MCDPRRSDLGGSIDDDQEGVMLKLPIVGEIPEGTRLTIGLREWIREGDEWVQKTPMAKLMQDFVTGRAMTENERLRSLSHIDKLQQQLKEKDAEVLKRLVYPSALSDTHIKLYETEQQLAAAQAECERILKKNEELGIYLRRIEECATRNDELRQDAIRARDLAQAECERLKADIIEEQVKYSQQCLRMIPPKVDEICEKIVQAYVDQLDERLALQAENAKLRDYLKEAKELLADAKDWVSRVSAPATWDAITAYLAKRTEP